MNSQRVMHQFGYRTAVPNKQTMKQTPISGKGRIIPSFAASEVINLKSKEW